MIIRSSKSGRFRWAESIIPLIIQPLLDRKRAKGSRYTIRGLCYTLESLMVIPKTEKEFNKVYDEMSAARKNGTISRNAFIDNTRYRIKKFNDEYTSVEKQIEGALDNISNSDFVEFAKEKIPRWQSQPYYVEIWVEKSSFAEILSLILKDNDVVIVPNRGWSSITFLEENILYLDRKLRNNPNIHAKVLYFGDLDPSGWAMDYHYMNEIQRNFYTDRFEFKRVAITKEQLDTFNLRNLTNPSPEVMYKLGKNPNRRKFENEFGLLFQIELEALESISEFEDLVKREVDSLYDESVHNEVMNLSENNLTQEQIDKIIEDWARQKYIRFKSGAPF